MTWVKDIGLSMVETDGPYGGEPCASENHSHHDSLEDSIYTGKPSFKLSFTLSLER